MSIAILKPNTGVVTYERAVDIFKQMYETVTNKKINVIEKDDGKSDLIVIGSDSVNDFVLNEIFDLRLDSLGIRYGTDDYCIRSYKNGERNALILAGGRGRSTLYAIYDYFERFLGCHYFWDGDIIPHAENIPVEDIEITESPRFEYRGLRYFAHRGLKRFQAEHWSFEDWKREIDWMVKKRLNFFMLRIGMDDVWQRAFPDDVPYPEKFRKTEEEYSIGYDDRADFWALKYRGELREKVLEYARSMDLMYPTDCGTMTHWYSRTPKEFLKRRSPTFAHQADKQYVDSDTGRVWDFTQKENMDNYMKLTETMVNEYEKNTELFHTIGLGERMMYSDRRKNHVAKMIAYRRISQSLRERYPNSKLMLASWDFVGWWSGAEVQSLIKELNAENTIILDYTSDVSDPDECFINWGVVGKFPWIFGLFHAYESESELRGAYERSDERLKIAAEDPYCKGMILWPELSHSDPLVLEYLSENAWSPLNKNIEEITAGFCQNRYGVYSEYMNECWQTILPFIKLSDWGSYSKRKKGDEKFVEYCSNWYAHQDIWTKFPHFLNDQYDNYDIIIDYYTYRYNQVRQLSDDIVNALRMLADKPCLFDEQFILRDSIDITRTVLGRFMNYLAVQAIKEKGNKKCIQEIKRKYLKLMNIMSELLALNDDFSIYTTLKYLESVAPTNPDYEISLKRNINNTYCTQAAYELVTYVFIDEAESAFDWLMSSETDRKPDFAKHQQALNEKFLSTLLKDMQPAEKNELHTVILKAADAIEEIMKYIAL